MQTQLEKVLVSFDKNGMVAYVQSHPEAFDELIQLAFKEKKPYSWRSAWLLSSCMEDNDPRIKGYVKKFIHHIESVNESQQRDYIIILTKMELDEDDEGMLFESCVNIWKKIQKKPAVRYNAFKYIVKIAKKYPDLMQEILLLTDEPYWEGLSPGVKRSLSKMIKSLKLKKGQ